LSSSPAENRTGEALVLIDKLGPVTRLTLNRPAQRNALSAELLHALRAGLRECSESRDVRVVVIAGAGPAFSAGHDLRELSSAPPAEVESLFRLCSDTMLDLQSIPQPVIARVQGIATAAGCQLVAACDLAVAAAGARFATPGVNIGLFCSTPAVPLVRSVGRKRALEMLFTGTPIDAQAALEWGLVNRVVPEAELDRAVDELAARIVAASRHTIALGKRAFYRQVALAEGEAYDVASAAMCENASADDAREGIQAFLEKRSPRWRDR
jgi:enoyl-CoA hydratase/carnithine racemase